MIPKNTFSVLDFLLRRPGRQYNVNQIARELEISVGSAHKILTELSGKEILKSVRMGNAVFHQLNLSSREARKLCELIFIEGRNSVLAKNPAARVYAEELQKFGAAKAIIMFGSILSRGMKAGDVDVLFVIDRPADVKKVNRFCLEASKVRAKPVVPLIMTEGDLKIKISEKDDVVADMIRTGVVLSGEDIVVSCMDEAG